jgi:hypothetical protein
MLIAAALLVHIASACPQTCLAHVDALGVDAEGALHIDADVAAALGAPRCVDAPTVDDACFLDDTCVAAVAPPAGALVVRVVVAGMRARVLVASVKPGKPVARRALDLIANEALPSMIAAALASELTETCTEKPIWPSVALVTGGTLVVVSAASGIGSYLALRQPETDGDAKQAALIVAWTSIAAGAVGLVTTGVGAFGALATEPQDSR